MRSQVLILNGESSSLQIDLMMISWAIHRLNGISCPANAAYSASELAFQLKNSRASCIFTCDSLYSTALKAAEAVGIPPSKIYTCPVAGVPPKTQGAKTLEELISRGRLLPGLEKQTWSQGQGKRQTAFICYSSGTSGLPVSLNPEIGGRMLSENRKEFKSPITTSFPTFFSERRLKLRGGRNTITGPVKSLSAFCPLATSTDSSSYATRLPTEATKLLSYQSST